MVLIVVRFTDDRGHRKRGREREKKKTVFRRPSKCSFCVEKERVKKRERERERERED